MKYAYYVSNQYVMMGSIEEIEKAQKMPVNQLLVVGSLLPLDVPADVDWNKLNLLLEGYSVNELALARGCAWNTMNAKLNGQIAFIQSDVEFFEDLFFLKEGELLK